MDSYTVFCFQNAFVICVNLSRLHIIIDLKRISYPDIHGAIGLIDRSGKLNVFGRQIFFSEDLNFKVLIQNDTTKCISGKEKNLPWQDAFLPQIVQNPDFKGMWNKVSSIALFEVC